MSSSLKLTVTHRGKPYELSFDSSATLADLQAHIAELTDVPVEFQKLLYGKGKGKKKAGDDDSETLADAGLHDGAKIMLLGSTRGEMDGLKATESEKHKREAILAARARTPTTKVWSRSSGSAKSDDFKYRFHRIEPLAHLPNADKAEALLKRLAEDPAIQHVMRLHEFSVGVLTELAPHEHMEPYLLGLNVNAGQSIKLRLRTDRYDGMRLYADVRRVLCHELTHNVWGDHDNNFKELNSKLNKEVAEFERARAAGAHTLGSEEYYDSALEADAYSYSGGSYVLGGSGTSTPGDDSPEARRRRAVEAATRRLREREEEIESMCGSERTSHAGPGQSS